MKYPTPAQYKKEYEFLKEVDSLALANEQIKYVPYVAIKMQI